MTRPPEVIPAAFATLPLRELAKFLSALESDVDLAQRLLREHPAPRKNLIGITGPPGAGKSQLVDALLTALRQRDASAKIGVVAVDPSSPRTGGALLGDRVRMMRHAGDPHIFIRSMASRGHLGGLAAATHAVARALQLAGCHPVLLETVGVGQSEVEVAAVADRTVLVLAPGAGDDVQLLKAGLMEVADLFVVNKADQPGADALHDQLLSTLSMQRRDLPVLKVSALHGQGISALLDALLPPA